MPFHICLETCAGEMKVDLHLHSHVLGDDYCSSPSTKRLHHAAMPKMPLR